jgi:predicted esterase/catechol 2,3-dioxygenase-like lactoylglutathione lyase family enzyme
MTFGIHHITALSSNAQKTYDFYTQVLGLRFIKKTVNFDAPSVYHLYFGNESGEPGTALTFFPFENIGTGTRGPGQVSTIYFAVSAESLGFWLSRFIQKNVRHSAIKKKLGKSVVTFYDDDGLQLELVASSENNDISPWDYKDIPLEHAIHGFFGAELCVDDASATIETLTIMGYEIEQKEEFHTRLVNNDAKSAKYLDIFQMKEWPRGKVAAGTNHHIAFRVPNSNAQEVLRQALIKSKHMPTEVIDRQYFFSVYFPEPNGILFEIATDEPGFTVDENLDSLGKDLKLPPKYERMRSLIEAQLPELHTEYGYEDTIAESTNEAPLFHHLSAPSQDIDHTLILFHGTGGDEYDLLPLAEAVYPGAGIVSLRGNVSEHGMKRFFVRHSDGTFDQESIKSEVTKLEAFLSEMDIDPAKSTFLGFSNGANFILSYLLLHPEKVKNAIILHGKLPFVVDKVNLSELAIFIASGEHDEYVTPEEFKSLKTTLSIAGAEVTEFIHNRGHEVNKEEVAAIVEWIAKHRK